MKRSVVIALVIALAATAWIVSGQFDLPGGGPPAPAPAATNGAPVEEKPLEVRVQRFSAETYHSRTTVTGRTQAVRQVELRAQTAGQIEEVGVPEGSAVREGDLIARIGIRDREARLAEAEALVAQRRSELSAANKLAEKGYRAKTELAGERAQYDQAMARLKQIQVEIAETRIRAPFEGVLEERTVEVGTYIEPGNEVATIVDLDPILIVGSVNETAVEGLSVGTSGRARLANGELLEGTVRYVASVANPQTRTFRVELEAPNATGRIRDGLTAELILPAETLDAHKIPASILTLSDAGEVGVKSIDEAGHVRFLPVQILADEPDGTWVAGLPGTVDLIVVGQEYAAEGALVDARAVAGASS